MTRRDMYLLENQIPLRILGILVYLRYGTGSEAFMKAIEKYSFNVLFNDDDRIQEAASDLMGDAIHLLEVFPSVIVRGQDHDSRFNDNRMCNVNMLSRLEKGYCKDDEDEMTPGSYVFRSMTDLKSKGIHLRASQIKSVMGIRFSPTELGRSAELKLPPMYVDIFTRVLLQNVIAFELAPQLREFEKKVTTYVGFMKLLVVTAEDAKELRENKIIINRLGSDDDVVQIYKDLNTYEASDLSYYTHTIKDIDKHYNSTTKMWMANLRTTYFSNPWTIIALVASLFILFLDTAQTYYAANPPKTRAPDANQ